MKVTQIIDKGREEEILVVTHEASGLAERIRAMVAEEERLIGFKGDGAVQLSAGEVDAFFTRDGRTYAVKGGGEYLVRLPLYKLEQRYPELLRINQSCLLRIGAIAGFRASVGGALEVRLFCGYTDYVSRRQMSAVKARLLGKG